MARLLIGSSLRRVVERWPFVHHCIWAVEAAVFAVFLGVCWCLPLSWAQAFASRLMSRVGPRQNKHRHVLRNLRIAFPDRTDAEREALGRVLWGNVGKVFAEYAHLYRIRRAVARRVEVHGAEQLQALARDDRAAILVTPHLGNWEIIGCVAHAASLSLSVVYTPLQNPYLDRIISWCRRAHSSGLLARDDSVRPLISEIVARRCVGFVMDQRVDTGSPVPLFGVDKLTTLVPARLALRHGVDLVPMRTERLAGGRFRLTICPPIVPADPGASREEQALQMTRRVNQLFEAWIRERPEDWFCTNRLWPKDAEPAAAAGTLAERSPGPA
ncbi:MAG: hypothetical protein JSV45_00760 [Chromatiales bacterium]|nr:MAG: hypothetical protein JSV45_00760 [Chromatiales bacterium]